jgi:hypothetical protein
MEKTNLTYENSSAIETLDQLKEISTLISEDVIFKLSDVYWDCRAHRRLIQKSINLEPDSANKRVLKYFEKHFLDMENSFKKSIKSYCQEFDVGRWALGQYGVGPLSVVRLLRYIDVAKTRSHEQLWAYAGLAPKSGPRQTYNSSLKDTCLDLARSFVRRSDKKECFYGQLFNKELDRRIELNEQGAYSDLAREEVSTDAKEDLNGEFQKLSIDRLRAQAQRYAVKIFLVHWYTIDYRSTYNQEYTTSNKNIIPIPGI